MHTNTYAPTNNCVEIDRGNIKNKSHKKETGSKKGQLAAA